MIFQWLDFPHLEQCLLGGNNPSLGSKNNDRLIQKYVVFPFFYISILCSSDEMAAKIIAKDNAFRTAHWNLFTAAAKLLRSGQRVAKKCQKLVRSLIKQLLSLDPTRQMTTHIEK